ncbi:FHA domain-containing protein [Nesterenkonia halobia]|uniref:FHA domain-containing protein n=1 Tax=Nesterenkonia halobia TaxID=37922 RepID=A0ABP6RMF6_9MICC
MANTSGARDESARSSESTSISLPPTGARQGEPRLTAEDQQAIAALPDDSALLIAHEGPNQGARFLLDRGETTAGRNPDAEIFLDDVTVSRSHLVLRRRQDGHFDLEDLGSLNGTYVNQDRVDRHQLSSGDEVQIGKFRLTFHSGRR